MEVSEIIAKRKARWREYGQIKAVQLNRLQNAIVRTGLSDPARHPRDTFDVFVNGHYTFTGYSGLERTAETLKKEAIEARAAQAASEIMTRKYWRGWEN